eukprot:9494673-Ditylum_brightwellii.AAC.1
MQDPSESSTIRLEKLTYMHQIYASDGKIGENKGRSYCEFCRLIYENKKFNSKKTMTFNDDLKKTTLGCIH